MDGPRAVRTYTEDDMNAAIARVETAKQNHPRGWVFLDKLGLTPSDALVTYAFLTADAHAARLGDEDRRLIYATGWLNGIAIGASLHD